MNIYEAHNREKKVHRLLEALDLEIGRTATEADADALTEEQLARVLARARVTQASDTTINALVDCLRARQANKGEYDGGTTGKFFWMGQS